MTTTCSTTPAAPALSIIIVSWNARAYLVDCLKSIEETARGLSYEVIVVDNASSDGSPAAVRQGFPTVQLIETGKNLGFARANNIAIRQSRGKYYCLINSDVIVKPQCLQRLLEFMENHPEVGLAGPRLLNGDGTVQISCHIPPTLMNRLARALFIKSSAPRLTCSASTIREVGILAGSFWIARGEAVEKVGLLDENFFFYGEDHDWCERFRAASWKIVFQPEAEAVHFGGASSAADAFRFNAELQKAVLQHWEKYHGRISTLAYLLIGMLYHGLRLGLRSLRLLWPLGNRAATVTKWKQHCTSFRWLGGAALNRLFDNQRATRSFPPKEGQIAL